MTIHIFQPLAARLGHPEVGGWKFVVDWPDAFGHYLTYPTDTAETGRQTLPTLRTVLAREDAQGRLPGLLTFLADPQNTKLYMVVVDGKVSHAKLDTPVGNSSYVALLPWYSGG